MTDSRLGRRILDQLRVELSERDEEILRRLVNLRFMTTTQVREMVFHEKRTSGAGLRAANRALAKLRASGLVTALDRRIGGVRAGSGSYVWTLTEGGARLCDNTTRSRRDRRREPSRTFLEHHLAVTEATVRLYAATRGTRTAVQAVQAEPDCWRPYNGPDGVRLTLKPDLAVTTRSDDFDDHWFFEIDLDTEPPSRIIRKSRQYEAYRRTGLEQRQLGVFPAVVWLVPDDKRRKQLERHLADADLDANVFVVITLDELPALVARGVHDFIKHTGGQKGGNPHESIT